MAEDAEQTVDVAAGDEEETDSALYKPPAERCLDDIVNQDQEDASLRKYKEQLLGVSASGTTIVVDPKDSRRVLVKKLAILVDGRPDIELDLARDPKAIKETVIELKEGTTYKVKIYFFVQYEIVAGLKYKQKVYKTVPLDNQSFMVGSYPPREEIYSYTTPSDEAPKGMLARGEYLIKSVFTDDDKNDYLSWEWKLKISKDWH